MYLSVQGLGATEAMGPPRDPSQPVEPPDVQQQIADLWARIFAQGDQTDCGCGVSVPVGATCPLLRADCGGAQSFTQTLNANAGKIALGAGAFFLVMAMAKR